MATKQGGAKPAVPINEAEIYRMLEARIQEVGTLTLAAQLLKVSPQLLSAVLSQKRALGPALLRGLGIKRVVTKTASYFLETRRVGTAAAVALLFWAAPAQAQAPTGYIVQYYNAGATSPLTQSDTIPASSVSCGQTPKITGTAQNTVNPTTVLWDDPANPATADCRVVFGATSSLFGLPIGASYEAVVVTVSVAGASVPSNRAPFSVAPLPPARTGVRFTR